LLFLVLAAGTAQASSGHYPNGLVGLKGASLPPPGNYWGIQSLYYSADKVKNQQGNTIDVNYSMDTFMFAPMFLYSSEHKILGARYAFSVLVPLVHTDFHAGKTFGVTLPDHLGVIDLSVSKSASKTGLSDVYISPLILAWEGDWYDISAGVNFFIPTGEYNSSDPASPGKGFWTFSPNLGATIYLDSDKTWSASAVAHYEIHSKQEDTRRTPGNHLHVEWGVGKTFAQIFKAGIVGYNSWQVSRDSGPRSRNGRTGANGIGPEVGVFIPGLDMDVTLRFFWEYENRSNAQGVTSVLSLMFPF
jgi:hypothetical protein